MESPGRESKSATAKRFQEKLAIPPGKVDSGWLEEARRVVERIFPKGWDRNWKSVAAQYTAAKGKAVAEEGLTSDSYWTGRLGWWHAHVVGGEEPSWEERWIPETRNVKIIAKDGASDRVITVASGKQHILAPLHKILYARLSRQKWLLRGEASETSLGDFEYKKGEVFVSGDYESATDNIPSTYSRAVLRLILARCRHVPVWIRDAAVDSLTGFTSWFGNEVEQLTGQMMGNYLSFPLLCLVNFVTFVFGVGRDEAYRISNSGLLKINGDDILFRATMSVYRRWASGCQAGGFTLSKGKTLTHSRFASINSAFFCITKKVRRVAVVRPKTWFYRRTDAEAVSVEGVAGRVARVQLDCRGKESVTSFFLGVWGKELAGLEAGSLVKTLKRLPVPRHVWGLTTWRNVVKATWFDPGRRIGKEWKMDSDWCRGPSYGSGRYWGKVHAEHVQVKAWTDYDALDYDLAWERFHVGIKPSKDRRDDGLVLGLAKMTEQKREKTLLMKVLFESHSRRVHPHAPSGVEPLTKGVYGMTFRQLWAMARKEWRRSEPRLRRDKGDLVPKGVRLGVPSFVTGGIMAGTNVKEGLWVPVWK
jgi:hypothetical protein